MQDLAYTIPTISCGHCKKNIENALGAVPGVTDVEVTVPEKRVSIRYDPSVICQDRIREILDDEGYAPG